MANESLGSPTSAGRSPARRVALLRRSAVQLPATKKYDVNQVTFGGEKTFFSAARCRWNYARRSSRRCRLRTSLPSALQGFNGGFDGNGNSHILVLTTPENTLGTTGTYFGNTTLIAKALLWGDSCSEACTRSGRQRRWHSDGPNTHIRVIDYASTTENCALASSQRLKDISSIDNDTFSLSPSFAALYAPGTITSSPKASWVWMCRSIRAQSFTACGRFAANSGAQQDALAQGSRGHASLSATTFASKRCFARRLGRRLLGVSTAGVQRLAHGIAAPTFEVHYTGGF